MANQFQVRERTLGGVIDSLREGEFVVPNFQRDFEWGNDDIRELMRSIFNDFFIGTIFLWPGDDTWQELLGCEPISGSKSSKSAMVLDGQQRLTAMYYAFFGHSDPTSDSSGLGNRWFFIDIKKFFADSAEERNSAFSSRNETLSDKDWFSTLTGGVSSTVADFFPYERAHGHLFPLRLLGAREDDSWLASYSRFWSNKKHQHDDHARHYQSDSESCLEEAEKLDIDARKQYQPPVEDGPYQKLQREAEKATETVSKCEKELESLVDRRRSLEQDLRQSTNTAYNREVLGKELGQVKGWIRGKQKELHEYKDEANKAREEADAFGRELDSRTNRARRNPDGPAKQVSIKTLLDRAAESEQNYRDHTARAQEAESNAELGLRFRRHLQDLRQSFVIPLVSIDTNMPEIAVSDMFSQLNRRGKRLMDYELLNAHVSLQGIPFKEMIRDFEDQLRDQGLWWERARRDVMRIMLIDVHPDHDFSLENDSYRILFPGRPFGDIVPVKDSEDFERIWKDEQSAYADGLSTLRRESFYGKVLTNTRNPNEFVPFEGILPVYCSLLAYATGDNDLEGRVRQWYWASVLMERYLRAQDSTNVTRGRTDYNEVTKWFDHNDQPPGVIRELRQKIGPDFLPVGHNNLRPRTRGSDRVPGLLMGVRGLLSTLQPGNWRTKGEYTAENVTEEYIVNQRWCEKEGIPETLAKSVFNEVLVDEATGEAMQENMPKQYLGEIFADASPDEQENIDDILRSHCISRKAQRLLMKDTFTADDFRAFLEERRAEFLRQLAKGLFRDLDLDTGSL